LYVSGRLVCVFFRSVRFGSVRLLHVACQQAFNFDQTKIQLIHPLIPLPLTLLRRLLYDVTQHETPEANKLLAKNPIKLPDDVARLFPPSPYLEVMPQAWPNASVVPEWHHGFLESESFAPSVLEGFGGDAVVVTGRDGGATMSNGNDVVVTGRDGGATISNGNDDAMSGGGDAAAAVGPPTAAELLPLQELPEAQYQPHPQLDAQAHVPNTDESALRLLVYSSLATAAGGGTWAAGWSAVAAAGGAAAARAGATRNNVCRLGADGDSMIAVKIRPTGGVGSPFFRH
jgi:hypothetical protein